MPLLLPGAASGVKPQALPVGAKVDSFEVTDILGAGGFGITYLAFDHRLERDIALKEYLPHQICSRAEDGVTLQPRSAGDTEDFAYGLKRFLDEARTLAKFSEPNIVRVNHYVEANGSAYFTMDYERGLPLADHLGERRTLSVPRLLMLGIECLRGLHAVHAKKFLHRDVKPANILLRDSGSAVLLDFGAAREALISQTVALTRIGTPRYSPVEQTMPSMKRVGAYTDLYALGATLSYCATGSKPTPVTDRLAALDDGRLDPMARALDAAKHRYGQPLIDTLKWMIEIDPDDRPQQTHEVMDRFIEHYRALAMNATGDAATQATRIESMPVALSEEDRARAESVLSTYLGPIAKVLVREAMEAGGTRSEFYEGLADELTASTERDEFLDRIKTELG